MGDAEGKRADAESKEADAEASVAVQRLAELMHGQEAALEIFVGQTGSERVTQSLESDTEQWRSLEQLSLSS